MTKLTRILKAAAEAFPQVITDRALLFLILFQVMGFKVALSLFAVALLVILAAGTYIFYHKPQDNEGSERKG